MNNFTKPLTNILRVLSGCTRLSPVFHVLLPVCQTFAPLLLLSQSFLGLCTQMHIFDDFADLLASFGGPLTLRLPVALLHYRKSRRSVTSSSAFSVFYAETDNHDKQRPFHCWSRTPKYRGLDSSARYNAVTS